MHDSCSPDYIQNLLGCSLGCIMGDGGWLYTFHGCTIYFRINVNEDMYICTYLCMYSLEDLASMLLPRNVFHWFLALSSLEEFSKVGTGRTVQASVIVANRS